MRVTRQFSSVFDQLLPLQLQVLSYQPYEAMRLTQFSLVGLVLFTMTWRGGSVIVISSPEDSSIVGDLAYVLTSCYGDRIRGVGLAGNLPDTLARILSTQHSIPVNLIESNLIFSEIIRRQNVQFRRPLPVFIVGASSMDELECTIDDIRSTIWWNHMASFFILDRSPKCSTFVDFLYVPWTRNVLNAKVICYRLFGGVRAIFNFNPYTTQAPAPWVPVNVFRAENNHAFAVFIRAFTKNEATCVNLDFDKTRNLGEYEISVEGPAPGAKSSIRSETTLNKYQYWSTRDRIFHNIFCSLNATSTYTSLWRLEDPMTADIRKIGRMMLYVWDFEKITYPHARTGFILVSKFRGHQTQFEKILNVIDFDSRLGVGIVYFVTLIFFMFFVRQALVPTLLNLVRMTCNTGFTNLPDKNAHRIFLGCLLFFVVTLQGIYQGNLASLLTKNIPLRNINVMKDVVDLDYRLYAPDFMVNFVKLYPQLDGHFIHLDQNHENCLAYMMNDSLGACLWVAQGSILDDVRKLELHTSSEFVATFYSGFEIRWDWPPEQRVNVILSRMVEADVIPPWDVKCKPLQLTDFKYDKEVLNNKDFKKIELAELGFAFVILGIGLVCATIVFVVEVAISPT